MKISDLFINLFLWIFILCVFVGLFFGVGAILKLLSKEDHYKYAFVQVGEEWQTFELEKYETTRHRYKLYIKDGTTLFVTKDKCILYNGTLPVGIEVDHEQIKEGL